MRSLAYFCAVVSVGCLIACGGAGTATTATTGVSEGASKASPVSGSPTKKPEPDAPDPVTLGNFYRVKTGMTSKEVFAILGNRCELMSEVNIGDIDTKLLMWKAKGFGGGNCNITFQNGRVTAKAQFGLTGDENSTATADERALQAERDEANRRAQEIEDAKHAEQVQEQQKKAREAAKIQAAAKAESDRLDKIERTRTWTSTNGKTLDAEFIRYRNGSVLLRKSDESEIEIPAEKLSETDREWIEARRRTK